ncbi:alpha/beta fold hydrolase [Nonomuraea sp. NPDC001699]
MNIWSEEFGAETDAPTLLIMGSMSQGILWPDEFVGRLTAGGRRVIRYDHRDTGMSGTVDFAAEPYTWDDIKNDVYRVLDAHGSDRAHLVGHSAGRAARPAHRRGGAGPGALADRHRLLATRRR